MKRMMRIGMGLSLVLAGLAPAQDWPTWRGPNRNGIVEQAQWNPQSLVGEPKVLWEKAIGLGYSAVAVQGDRVYAVGNNGQTESGKDVVYCLDAGSGHEIWTYAYTCVTDNLWPGPSATPVVDDDKLYTICDDTGELFCLNVSKGRLLWKVDMVETYGCTPPYDGVGYSGSPVIEGDLIVLNMNSAGIALNKKTGQKVWASAPGRCSFSTPVIFTQGAKKKVALFGADYLFILDLATGRIDGKHPWKTNCNENSADPIVFQDKVFVSSCYGVGGGLMRLGNGDPIPVWKSMALSNLFGSSIYRDGYLYGIDGERRRNALKCVEAETGEVRWSEKVDFGSFIAVNGQLVFLSETGELRVVEAVPEKYIERARSRVRRTLPQNLQGRGRMRDVFWWTTPVLAHGRLYLRSDKGHLLCLDVR